MLELSRTIRFCLNGPDDGRDTPKNNTFAAWPPMRGLGRYYQLHVRCAGEADPVTGYFINIRDIDQAVRGHVLPLLNDVLAAQPDSAAIPMGSLMQRMLDRLRSPLNRSVAGLTLELTPYHRLEIRSNDMAHVIVRQQFEFSAAHRLHVDRLSDDENREVFGKCNNPSGHGHNYRLEVAVRAPIDTGGRVAPVEKLDGLVDRVVIQRLDHKHLSVDVPEFRGLNTSVENIAVVVWGMLEKAVREIGVELDEVSVWETGKTVCTYRGDTTTKVLPV
ncbi:MAG: 6-carboxytetrahydropterin synthase [Planctomycetes bacterium]|nr:6-carboxytetrahydropterin synthase [Planctomycetota bacterium]